MKEPSFQSHDVCADLGFDSGRSNAGAAVHLDGYKPVSSGAPFPSGLVEVEGRTIGVLRIGGFEPQGTPKICRAALKALAMPQDKPCDDHCEDAILTWAYDSLTRALEEQVKALKTGGASVLVIDLTGNGGGTEWAEAAARIVSPVPLTSEKRGYVRGPHWSRQWSDLATKLRNAASTAGVKDQERLLAWAGEADAAHADANMPCARNGSCSLIGVAGYATGLVGRAEAGEFVTKPWRDLVFSIAQFPYHDSVWRGPLIVLTDDQTWSAAEEFAAILQDNRAAIIAGARTGGAGCGHTNGGTPTVLTHSGATLLLPDCVRFRADGSNEVSGVIPDVLIGVRANDGEAYKARLIREKLPEAITQATIMWAKVRDKT